MLRTKRRKRLDSESMVASVSWPTRDRYRKSNKGMTYTVL